jgi:hypothetical protein
MSPSLARDTRQAVAAGTRCEQILEPDELSTMFDQLKRSPSYISKLYFKGPCDIGANVNINDSRPLLGPRGLPVTLRGAFEFQRMTDERHAV